MEKKRPTLAVFFSKGTSIATWRKVGILDRRKDIYAIYAPFFKEILFVSYGKTDSSESLGPNTTILGNNHRLRQSLYSLVNPFLHWRSLRQADVLMTLQMSASVSACLAKPFLRKPLVIRCGYIYSDHIAPQVSPLKLWLVKLLERLAYKYADKIIVTTDQHKVYASQYTLPEKIQVIPNGVNVDKFRPILQLREKGTIGCVAKFTAQKNLFALIEAVSGIEGAKLCLVGDGKLREDLLAFADRVRAPVDFVGNVPNDLLPQFINRAEVFVLPSLYEGHPKALLEAMACGVPVIASEIPAHRAMIVHGNNGYLCQLDSTSIRSAIVAVMEDRELQRRLGLKGRKYVVDECNLKNVVEQEIEVLLQTCCRDQLVPKGIP